MEIRRFAPIGVRRDVAAVEFAGAAYRNLTNMVANSGKMSRAPGLGEIWPTPLFGPKWLHYTPQDDDEYWVYANETALATVSSGGVHTDRTATTFTSPANAADWTGGNLNGVACVNNPQNTPMYWVSGNALFQELPNLRPSTFYKVLRPFKYHLIGMNYTDANGQFADGVQWSDAADPGNIPATWLPAEDNEAGDNILADENGPIIDGLALRDSFYVYKQDTVYQMDYVGGNEVFRFTKVFGTQGILSNNCVVRVRGSHVVLGNGEIYRHDGQNIEQLAEGRVRNDFFNRIDKANYAKSFVIYNETRDQVAFCVPSAGSDRVNFALIWHASTNEFGFVDIPPVDYGAAGIVSDTSSVLDGWDNGNDGSWEAGQPIPWSANVGTLDTTEESTLYAQADEVKLQLLGKSQDFDGVPFGSSVYVESLDFGEPMKEKAFRRIWPRVDVPGSFNWFLTVWGQEHIGEAPRVLESKAGNDLSEGIALNSNVRYLGLQFGTDDQTAWSISGFDVEFNVRGHF